MSWRSACGAFGGIYEWTISGIWLPDMTKFDDTVTV
jgi:hypothetical protein